MCGLHSPTFPFTGIRTSLLRKHGETAQVTSGFAVYFHGSPEPGLGIVA